MVRPIKEETYSKLIDWLKYIALFISILLFYQYVYALLGLTVLFGVFLVLLRLRRYYEEETPDRNTTLRDTTLGQVEDKVKSLRRAVEECCVALDHSRRLRSRTEHTFQVGASLYFFLALFAYVRRAFPASLTPPYQAGAFLCWAGLLFFGLAIGDLYTSYVKTCSGILGARKIRKVTRTLADQSEALETLITESASRPDDSVLSRNMSAQRLKTVTEQLVSLESRARTRASDFGLKDLLIALAAFLASVFPFLGQIEITVTWVLLLVLAVLIGVSVLVVPPYGRAYSLLRVLGFHETAKRIQQGLSNLQAMTLSEEDLRLVQSSFLSGAPQM